MKNFLIKFIQRHGFRCVLMLYLLEPIFCDHTQFARVLFCGIVLIFALYLIYLLIGFFRSVKYNHWASRRESKELILLDIYICGLGILGQYLTALDMSTFFSNIILWLFILFSRLVDLFSDKSGEGGSRI